MQRTLAPTTPSLAPARVRARQAPARAGARTAVAARTTRATPTPTPLSLRQPTLPPRRRSTPRSVLVHASSDESNPLARAGAAAAYVFPLFDSIRFARFLFLAYPATRAVLIPLKPLASLYFSIPLASLVVFFGLYLGIVRNGDAPRFVRYHAAQAVMLDVLLVLPGLVESLFRPPSGGLGLQLLVTFSNTIAIFAAACFVLGAGGALLGKTVRLPLVADAADAQVGGY